MLIRQHVASSILPVLLLIDIFTVTYCQFLNGPRRNPLDPIKNFRNIPRVPGNAAIGNFPRSNLNYVQQNSLRFHQLDPRLLDRRDVEGSDSDRGSTGDNSELSQFDNTGFCRDGWTEASIDGVAICIRVNTEPSSWDDAQEKCRNDYSFLLKLEVPIKVQSKSIQDHLLSLGIKNVWTGLHSEHDHLVWDDISPSLVIGNTGSDKSPWTLDEDILKGENELCGEIDIQDNSHIIEAKRRRKKRAPDNNRPRLLNQFQNFFQQTTPSNSKEVVDNSPSPDFRQLNIADRFRSLNNNRKMIHFGNMRQRPFANREQTNVRAFNRRELQHQNRRYQNRQRINTKDLLHDSHQTQNMPTVNVRPVNNERYLSLLKMLRSGSNPLKIIKPTKQSETNLQNTQMPEVLNKEVTTLIPPEDDIPVNTNLENLPKFGDLFNKPKIDNKPPDDDDKKLQFDKLNLEMLTTSPSFDTDAQKKFKGDDLKKNLETLFNSPDKVAETENKTPIELLQGIPNIRIEKKRPTGDVLEKIFSDDKLKVESENANKDIMGDIKPQQSVSNDVSKDKKKSDDIKEANNPSNPPTTDLSIDNIQSTTLDSYNTDDTQESTKNKLSDDKPKTILDDIMTQPNDLPPTPSNLPPLPSDIAPLSDAQPLPVNVKHLPSDGQQSNVETLPTTVPPLLPPIVPSVPSNVETISDVPLLPFNVQPLPSDSQPTDVQPLPTNVPLVPSNIPDLPSDDQHSGFISTTTASSIINDQIAAMKDVIQVEANTEDDAALKQLDNLRVAKEDVKSTDMNIDKAIAEIDEALAHDDQTKSHYVTPTLDTELDKNSGLDDMSAIMIDSANPTPTPKTEIETQILASKDNANDENDMLLKLLEGIDSDVDSHNNKATSIKRLKEQLEGTLKQSKGDNSQNIKDLKIEIDGDDSTHDDTVKTKGSNKDDVNMPQTGSIGGLIIHPFEPEVIDKPSTNDDTKPKETTDITIDENLYDKIIEENGGNVENILNILNKLSEKKPTTDAAENDIMTGSVVQQMMTNDGQGTSIGLLLKPANTKTTDDKNQEISNVKIEEDNAEDKLKLEPSNGENSPIVNDLQSTPGGITIMENIHADDTGLMADLSNDMVDTVKDDTSVLDGNAPVIVDDSTDESIGVDDSSVTSIDVSGSLDDATQSVNDESITVDSVVADDEATKGDSIMGDAEISVELDDSTNKDIDESITIDDSTISDIVKSVTVDDSTKSDIVDTVTVDDSTKSEIVDTVTVDDSTKLDLVDTVTVDDSTISDIIDTVTVDDSTKSDTVESGTVDDSSLDVIDSSSVDADAIAIDDSTTEEIDATIAVDDSSKSEVAATIAVLASPNMESDENLIVDVSSKPEVDIPVAIVKSLEVDESLHDDVSLADATDDVINVDDGVLPDDSLETIAVEGIPLMSEGDNFAKEDEAVLDEISISASDDKVSTEIDVVPADDLSVPLSDNTETKSDGNLSPNGISVLMDDEITNMEDDQLLLNTDSNINKQIAADDAISDMADIITENEPVRIKDGTDDGNSKSSDASEMTNDIDDGKVEHIIEEIIHEEEITGHPQMETIAETRKQIVNATDLSSELPDAIEINKVILPGGDSVEETIDDLEDFHQENNKDNKAETIIDNLQDSVDQVNENNDINNIPDITQSENIESIQDTIEIITGSDIIEDAASTYDEIVEKMEDNIDGFTKQEVLNVDDGSLDEEVNSTNDFSDEYLGIENYNTDNDMIDIINDATDEIIMAESEDSKLMEELHNNKSDLIDDFDVEVNEDENVGKEIISDEASADIENAFSESTIDQTSQDMSTEIENATVSSDSELVENITDIFDSSEDMLVSEAAAQDDVRQSEFRELDITRTADDLLDEEAEEFVPPADIVEHIPQPIENPNDSVKDTKKLIMRLGGCEKQKPSVCFSHPIKIDTDVSMCGTGWYGNVFVNKCYRYIPQAMTFTFARDTCMQEGGRLAVVDSNFLRKFILTSVTLARYTSNIQNNVINVWIHTDQGSRSCRLLGNRIGIQNVNCLTIAEAVCEKPKEQISPVDDSTESHDFEYVQPGVQQFPKDDIDNKLQCSLDNVASELPVMWYKDGIPITTKVTRSSSSLPSLADKVVTPTSDLYLTSDLTQSLGDTTNSTMEMLQGRYWCEAWTINPFKRIESKPTLVRFSDVMAFVGRLDIRPVTSYEYTVHNMLNQPSQGIPNVVKDLQVLHDGIIPDIKEIIPEVEKIQIKPDIIEGKQSQRLKFYTYVTMATTYTMVTERSVNLLMRRELREQLQNTSLVLSLPGKTPIHLIRSLQFLSTVACPMDRLKDRETSLIATFPSSAIGLEVTSVETCEGEVAGKAKCDGDYESGAYWTEVRVFKTCNNNGGSSDDSDTDSDSTDDDEDDKATVMGHISLEDRLKELAEVDVEDDNVDAIMDETAEILEAALEMTAEYVDYVAEIVDKTANIDHTSLVTSENIVRTVDKILDIDDDELKKTKKANSIIKNLEKMAENMVLDMYGKFRIVTPNVALEVWDLKYQSLPVIGLAAKEVYKTTQFEESHIVTLYNRSQGYFDDVNAAIELPPELVNELMTGKESRLYMMVYRYGRLFQTMDEAQSNLEQKKEAQFVDESGLLNSFVISASIGGKKIERLKNKVKTIFKPLKDVPGKEKTCAHWDFTLNNNRGGWSARGCVYNGTVNGRDICLCDHLTNFAVLIDFYGQAEPIPEHHEISLSIISLIGLSLSILGLSLTIISYAFFKKLRRGRAQQTLFNLALAMLCSWVVFLTGIKQTHSYYGCIIVAVLLHYFILSTFMWMLMEAFLQYLTFVKVLGTYVTRYTLKTVLIAWGLPLVPVISILSIDYNLYSGGNRYCWMSLTAFYYSFAIPVGCIILCNMTVFIVTVISICRRPTGLRSNQSKSKMAMANLQAAITSFVLLGLTWFLGYLAISDARLPFQYAFTILNSLQGFFIFILFVLRKKRVRDQWLILCCCKTQEQEKVLRSLSASGSIPSTGSGRSSYSGRSERSDSTRTTTSFVNDSYDSLFFPFKSSRSSLYFREKSHSVTSE